MAVLFIASTGRGDEPFFNATVNAGFHYSTTCIWVKDTLVLGRADFFAET